MTQTERILHRLNSGPMCSMEPLDWEPRIYRVAARIKDLRDRGHDITAAVCQEHFDPTSNHARYKLATQSQEELF